MSLFGRAEKRDIADRKAREQRLVAKVERLEEDLRTARFNERSKIRQNEKLTDENAQLRKEAADYSQMLAREVVEADEDVDALRQELATLRRQLRATQKQLDDATGKGDAGLLFVRPRPSNKGQVTA